MNLTSRKRDEKGRYLPNVAEPKRKRKAIVKYRRTADGQNKIVALEGFLTSDEIKAIGPEVYRLWDSDDHGMYRASPRYVFCRGWGNVYVGQIFNDDDFSGLIAEMKTCGRVLSRLVRDVRAVELAEIKVIEI